MRKLVLPDLAEPALKSPCLTPCEPHLETGVQEQASALRYSSPEMSVLGMDRLASGSSRNVDVEQQQHEAAATSAASPELSGAPLLRGNQLRNRSLHVLEDSSEGGVSSQGSPAAAGSWDADSSAGERDGSPGSSSGPALSSGLRSAVRQLGSSYRLGPGRGTLHGSPIRADAGRIVSAEEPQAFDSPTGKACGERDVFELPSSEGVYFQLPFDTFLALGS